MLRALDAFQRDVSFALAVPGQSRARAGEGKVRPGRHPGTRRSPGRSLLGPSRRQRRRLVVCLQLPSSVIPLIPYSPSRAHPLFLSHTSSRALPTFCAGRPPRLPFSFLRGLPLDTSPPCPASLLPTRQHDLGHFFDDNCCKSRSILTARRGIHLAGADIALVRSRCAFPLPPVSSVTPELVWSGDDAPYRGIPLCRGQ